MRIIDSFTIGGTKVGASLPGMKLQGMLGSRIAINNERIRGRTHCHALGRRASGTEISDVGGMAEDRGFRLDLFAQLRMLFEDTDLSSRPRNARIAASTLTLRMLRGTTLTY